MKKTILTTILMMSVAAGFAQAGDREVKKYKVTVVNLTKGQPLTPPVIAVHAPKYDLVHLGQPASEGLAALAQDGVTTALEAELEENRKVVRSVTGEGVILPGQKQEIIVEANNPRFQLTVLSMLARTNDAFIAGKNLSLKLRNGRKSFHLASVYDAGVEANTELCAHIPAPPCGNAMVGTEGGEGFVRPHEGLTQVGDLDPARDAFAGVAAKIIIERVR